MDDPPERESSPIPALRIDTTSRRLADFLGGERGLLLHLDADVGWPSTVGRLAAGDDLAYEPVAPGVLDGFKDESTPQVRLAVSGSAGSVGYGLNYQSVGKHLEHLATPTMRGSTGGPVGRAIGRHRSAAAVARAVRRQRGRGSPRRHHHDDARRISLEMVRPSWPTLSLSYSRGLAETQGAARGSPAAEGPITASVETVDASLGYHGWSRVDVSLSSGLLADAEPSRRGPQDDRGDVRSERGLSPHEHHDAHPGARLLG